MPGPYRECPNHGWLEIGEWVVDPGTGSCLCPLCETEVSGRYAETHDPFRDLRKGGPTHHPRERFIEAVKEYHAAE